MVEVVEEAEQDQEVLSFWCTPRSQTAGRLVLRLVQLEPEVSAKRIMPQIQIKMGQREVQGQPEPSFNS